MKSNPMAAALDELQADFDRRASAQQPRRPKKLRRKDDLRREKEALFAKYVAEIDELMDAYYEIMKEKEASAIGTLYARHSSRFQDSIADQIRVILEDAVRKKIFIPREHVCFDIAIRGYKERRPGLTAFKKLIAENKVQAAMVFATSRLYRRTYRTLQFVEEELVEREIRGIFVKSNVDTADGDNWRTLLQSLAANDEAQVRLSVAHIQAAQEGLFVRGMVSRELSLGFTGEVVDGEFTRRNLPRRRIVVDPQTARWIVQIYCWYVVDGFSVPEIVRRLNADPDAPAPVKSTTGLWSRRTVMRHLRNAEYRGWWNYGASQNKWLSKKDYAVQVARDVPLRQGQFEELRIIPDDCWYAAQTRLDSELPKSGRKSRRNNHLPQLNLLRQLFVCPEHQRKLIVSGDQGKVLLCPTCGCIEAEQRPLFTHLNRKLALEMTCERLAELIAPTDHLVKLILESCRVESQTLRQSNPQAMSELQRELNRVSAAIDFNRSNPGITEDEHRQTQGILRDLRCQQNELVGKLRSAEASVTSASRIPKREEVVEFLALNQNLLRECQLTNDETELRKARQLIDAVTGRSISLYQMGARKRSKGHLQGRFQADPVTFAVEHFMGTRLSQSGTSQESTIDYKMPDLIEEQSETAKRLWDDDLLHVEIARQMGCNPSYVTKLIQHWHDKRGLPRPDNKARRKKLENKQSELPLYKQIANEVHDLVEAGHSNLEIARRVSTSDANVGKAIKWWHETRGLPVPTAADRRRKKLSRAKSMLDEGMLIKDVAGELGYSARGLKLALEKDAEDSGGNMVDGRTRRGNATAGNLANGASEAAQTRAA